MDCLFCKIINGDIPSYTVYEDEMVKVFLDINPNTNGHILIIPKKHIVTVNELDDELICHILEVEKKMYALLKDKLKCDGITIAQNNEYGQEVKHYHVHMIPRYIDDEWEQKFNPDIKKDVKEIYEILTK